MSSSRNILPIAFLFELLLIALITVQPRDAEAAEFLRIHFISVGYGDAILIEMPDSRIMMVDAGEMPHADKVMDYLKGRDVKRVDWGVITHPHNNHYDGYFRIIESLPVGKILINGDQIDDNRYGELLSAMKGKKIPVKILKEGNLIGDFDPSLNIMISVVHPPDFNRSTNGNSIALLIRYRDFSMLLTGDITPEAQKILLDSHPYLAAIDYVQIPHHAWPTHGDFTSAFKEKTLFASTGPNRWRVPKSETLSQFDGTIYRTDRHGDIVISTDGYATTVKAGNAD